MSQRPNYTKKQRILCYMYQKNKMVTQNKTAYRGSFPAAKIIIISLVRLEEFPCPLISLR